MSERHRRHIFGRPIGVWLVVIYKALWGAGEIAIGLLLLFSSALVSGELAEDPQDLFVHWLLTGAHIEFNTAEKIGLLLLFYGFLKWAIALGVWMESWKMRRILLVFLLAITVFAWIDLSDQFGVFKLITFLADVFILYYVWRVLPHHMRKEDDE